MKVRMAPRAAHAQGLTEPQPQTHTWEHSRGAQAMEKPHAGHPGWLGVPQHRLGYSQKPTCNLWSVFTKRLCLKPLNLLIPRDEDTVFVWQTLQGFNTNLFNT